jgi:hypothetical protein
VSEGQPGGRAQPYYCPYCGEQTIRPAEEHGTYWCETCDRTWGLTFKGLGQPKETGEA